MFRVGNQLASKSALAGFEEFHIPEPNSGCWLWTASINNRGYGTLQRGGFKGYAHRFSFQHFKADGADITGMSVCHSCDNPSCVNPDHLFLGTASDNMRDCLRKGRHASQRTATNYARGEDVGVSRLGASAVRKIRALKGIIGAHKIAKAFDVTRGTIRDIHSGKTWTHV